jgi:hypothetical protein
VFILVNVKICHIEITTLHALKKGPEGEVPSGVLGQSPISANLKK